MDVGKKVELIKRNAEEILNSDKIKKFMKTGVVYCGYECSGEIHLGHLVTMMKLLDFQKKGFYLDIGASDPNRFNNTKRFYLKGWCGINIEPDVLTFKKIKKFRSRDINLNIGLGKNNNGLMNFFIFFPQMLSTFNKKVANNYIKKGLKL